MGRRIKFKWRKSGSRGYVLVIMLMVTSLQVIMAMWLRTLSFWRMTRHHSVIRSHRLERTRRGPTLPWLSSRTSRPLKLKTFVNNTLASTSDAEFSG